MSAKKIKFLWFTGLFFLSATTSKKHTIWLYVNNTSTIAETVDLSLSIIPKNEKTGVMIHQDLKQGLQELPSRKLSEGVYEVKVNTNHNQVSMSQMLTVDSDRWVIINYEQQDSASIIKTNGYLDTTHYKKVDSGYASMYMYIDNRRPPNL